MNDEMEDSAEWVVLDNGQRAIKVHVLRSGSEAEIVISSGGRMGQRIKPRIRRVERVVTDPQEQQRLIEKFRLPARG